MRKKGEQSCYPRFQESKRYAIQGAIWQVPWESPFEDLGVRKCWSVFKKHLLKAQEQAISLHCMSSKQGRRPPWLNRELFMEPKRKKKLYDLWNQGQALQED